MARVSEEIMGIMAGKGRLRYFVVKEAMHDGKPCMTLVKEYKQWSSLINFLRTLEEPVWVWAARVTGPMHRNTDLWFEQTTGMRWMPGTGFEKARPPHVPYYRDLSKVRP